MWTDRKFSIYEATSFIIMRLIDRYCSVPVAKRIVSSRVVAAWESIASNIMMVVPLQKYVPLVICHTRTILTFVQCDWCNMSSRRLGRDLY